MADDTFRFGPIRLLFGVSFVFSIVSMIMWVHVLDVLFDRSQDDGAEVRGSICFGNCFGICSFLLWCEFRVYDVYF